MTSSQTKIVLYDIPSTLPERAAFSPFTNAVRWALQYKRLAFTTEFIELVDISKVAPTLGIKPTGTKTGPDGNQIPAYTLPAIIDSTSGKPVIVEDSVKIIQYLETTYPDPERSLFPGFPASSSPAPALYLLADQQIMGSMMICFPLIAEQAYSLIPEPSKAYWKGNFLRMRGASDFKDVCPQKGTEAHYEQTKKLVAAFEGLADVISKNGSSSTEVGWLAGGKPTYTDLKLRAVLFIIKHGSEDTWAHVKGIKGGLFEKYMDAWTKAL